MRIQLMINATEARAGCPKSFIKGARAELQEIKTALETAIDRLEMNNIDGSENQFLKPLQKLKAKLEGKNHV